MSVAAIVPKTSMPPSIFTRLSIRWSNRSNREKPGDGATWTNSCRSEETLQQEVKHGDWNAKHRYQAATRSLAGIATSGVAGNPRHAAHVDADSREGSAGTESPSEPLVGGAPLRDCPGAHHVANPLWPGNRGTAVRLPGT